MGVHTRVYEIDGDLAVNIPHSVLPPSKLQLVEERVTIPGYEAETTTWYDVIVRPYTGRTALLLTHDIGISEAEAMSRLGLDTIKPIYVRPFGTTRWIKAHLYHGYYGRVWIPRDIARRTKMREYTTYPVMIRGITLPTVEIRYVRKEVRTVIVEHMDRQYPTENYAPNRWRWRIPRELVSHPVLLQGFKMIPPIYPLAEVHRLKDIIYIDFFYYSEGARKVSSQINYAYRSLACRNYVAAATIDLGYPFLCEIRVSHIHSMPKRFYQIKERAVYDKGALTLKHALETCVYNLLQYFFPHAREGKYSSISYAEHMGTIEFTTEKIELQRRYPRLRNVPRIISLGETSIEPWDIMEYPYYKAIKYIRIINEDCYKKQEFTRYIYTNDDVERVLYQNEEKRLEAGLPRAIWLDDNGFVWRTFADED